MATILTGPHLGSCPIQSLLPEMLLQDPCVNAQPRPAFPSVPLALMPGGHRGVEKQKVLSFPSVSSNAQGASVTHATEAHCEARVETGLSPPAAWPRCHGGGRNGEPSPDGVGSMLRSRAGGEPLRQRGLLQGDPHGGRGVPQKAWVTGWAVSQCCHCVLTPRGDGCGPQHPSVCPLPALAPPPLCCSASESPGCPPRRPWRLVAPPCLQQCRSLLSLLHAVKPR